MSSKVETFVCVMNGRVTERKAATPSAAADQCAAAVHAAYWAEHDPGRDGADFHGGYLAFTIKSSASRAVDSVRVYRRYEP